MKKFETTNKGIKEVIKIITNDIKNNIEKYKITDKKQTSVIFLAGAPGSGKTEFIESILYLKKDFFFVDVDFYRNYFKKYNGVNSKGFQKSISHVIDGVLKFCFKNDIKFILDGTFKSKIHVIRNIENCERKHRKIEIYFIFQNPYISYFYTFLRELEKERNIPIDGFIDCFYNSIENIFYVKKKYIHSKLFILEKYIDSNGQIQYEIKGKIENLTKFCKLYNIEYQNEKFLKRDFLFNGIKKFNFILRIFSPMIKIILSNKKKIGQKK